VAYHSESIEQLNRADHSLLGVTVQAETYRLALNEEKLEIDVFSASELSPESTRLDKQRDKAYSRLKAWLKVYANDMDNAVSEAAERLLFVLRKSAIELGDPLTLGLSKATTAINSLLRNLEPLRSDIELTGAIAKLNELEAANRAFEELQIERNLEKAGKRSGNVKAARTVTDAAYQALVERINAQALLYGGEIFDSFIKAQNAIIDKYASLIAQRKSKVKN
jgi:hypothetical protein